LNNIERTNGSTFYSDKKVSSCQIAGAIALCAVKDLKVNLFAYSGFPHIQVDDEGEKGFKITLRVFHDQAYEESFYLTRSEAFAAGKSFQSKNEYYKPIFDRVQDALSKTVG